MFSFNLLSVFFPDRMMLGEACSVVGTPVISIKTCQTKWHSELLQLYEHCIGRRSQDIRQDSPAVMVNCMPQPPWMPCVPHITPHLVHLSFVNLLDDDVHIWWCEVPEERLIHVVQLWFLFLNVFITVVGLTFKTRAVSRMPLPFSAISIIWVLTSCKNPLLVYSSRNVWR